MEELVQSGSEKTELEIRGILGCFLFSDDDVHKQIKVLSGGEKSRVALAKTLLSESNFLLLDEPTNHLDIQSVNMLIQALQQYGGSFVVVSHDRHFVQEIANKVWFIEDKEIKEYPGTYLEYVDWMEKREASKQLTQANTKKTKENKKEKPKTKPKTVDQKLVNQAKQELKKVEKSVEELEEKKSALEVELASEAVFSNPELLAEKAQLLEKVELELDAKNQRWEELVDFLD